jgi:methionyl-tRNA synthetase
MNPITPKATRKLWAALAHDTLGHIEDQKLRDAANWGQLKPGAAVGELEGLFPRIEAEAN